MKSNLGVVTGAEGVTVLELALRYSLNKLGNPSFGNIGATDDEGHPWPHVAGKSNGLSGLC
jgi:hypothetical protein